MRMTDVQHVLASIRSVKREINRLREEEGKAEAAYIQANKDRVLWFGKKKVDQYVALANQYQQERKIKENELYRLREMLPAEVRDQTYDD